MRKQIVVAWFVDLGTMNADYSRSLTMKGKRMGGVANYIGNQVEGKGYNLLMRET